YVHLADGAATTLVPVGDDFWQTIHTRPELHEGRLLTAYNFPPGAWAHWERHPAGDEIVLLLSGALDLVFDADGRRRGGGLRRGGRGAGVIPRGVWHVGVARAASKAISTPRGEGTDPRPLTPGDRLP